MIIIRDKINYLEETSEACKAANIELRTVLAFLYKKLYALQYKEDFTIDFYGLPAAENAAEPYLHWEASNEVLDQLIIFFLNEYNHAPQDQEK